MYEERTSVIDGAIAWQAVHDGPVRVLPDGCMDLLWMDGRVVVAGPDEVAHVHAATAGERVLGLRFRPGVLPALLGVPADQLIGLRVALDDVVDPTRWHPVLTPDADPLDDPDPTSAFEALLAPTLSAIDRSEPLARHWDHLTRELVRGATVVDLADSLGYSERQLSRRCRQHIGYGPARLRRVLRLQRALSLQRDGMDTTAAAASAGYVDASHLHRDARALAGAPLSALV
ncbi:MAG: helix-turn-helix domain-containing protein [Microthrixaceae bacterium]